MPRKIKTTAVAVLAINIIVGDDGDTPDETVDVSPDNPDFEDIVKDVLKSKEMMIIAGTLAPACDFIEKQIPGAVISFSEIANVVPLRKF